MKHKVKQLHFIGIGGSGMSGIAEVLLNLGYQVSGSDLSEGVSVKRLRTLGAKIIIGHAANNITGADVVVVSSAVKADNPEVIAAKSARIPIVARYPKWIKPGASIDGMALNIDISPTFLEMAGLPTPASMHGRSLGPLLRGNSKDWRKSFLAEYFEEPQNVRVPTWQAVRTERHKYVHYLEHEEFDELYDLKSDPYELKNRIHEAGAKKVLTSLKAELADINRKTA